MSVCVALVITRHEKFCVRFLWSELKLKKKKTRKKAAIDVCIDVVFKIIEFEALSFRFSAFFLAMRKKTRKFFGD